MSTPVDRPRVVGRYMLYGEIAAGGMATVHFGRLLGPVGFARTVAIKRLYPHFAKDAEFVAMFLDEGRLAARIRHPNVVQTLDVVATQGELFLVMDYVHGESLSRLRRLAAERNEPIPLRIATSILSGTLHGLHAAHEATTEHGESLDIVHRDVSPQNVLVGTDGIARVLDFGVAKAVGRAHATRDGKLKGKLAYMAPEQLEGRATRQTDIFAASVVLWEVLTGERLFGGDDEREVIGKVLGRRPEPPSLWIARRKGPPGATHRQLEDLDAVTLRGLSQRPEDRFETARSMAIALERCMGIASPTEVGEWLEHTAGDFLRQRSGHVAEIESHSTSSPRVTAATPGPGGLPVPVPSTAEPLVHTQVSSTTVSGSTSPTRPTRRRSWGWAAVAGLGVTLLVLVGLSRRQSSAVRQPPLAASAMISASSAPVPEPSAASPSPPASEPAATVSVARVNDAGRPQRGVAPRRPAPPRKLDCNPPYTVDEAGHQNFKEECFR
jgi:serine/threonine-protein kinase